MLHSVPPVARLMLVIAALSSIDTVANHADAGVMATLSIENALPSAASPGETVSFEVWLRDLVTDSPFDFVEAFTLDFSASDPALTADYSSFDFQLDSGLSGILGGLVFDSDASDDGIVSFGADTPPFGIETGISTSLGDIQLGQLSLSAPSVAGTYGVSLAFDNADPFSPTFLVVNDGLFGQFVPADGTLVVSGASFVVDDSAPMRPVPEPSSIAIMLASGIFWAGVRLRSRGT